MKNEKVLTTNLKEIITGLNNWMYFRGLMPTSLLPFFFFLLFYSFRKTEQNLLKINYAYKVLQMSRGDTIASQYYYKIF